MKKTALVVLAMCILTLATPFVCAKPTEAANSDKFLSFVWHSENGKQINVDGSPVYNPPGSADSDAKVIFTQASWELNPLKNNFVQIGDESPTAIAASGYEGYLYVQTTVFSPTYRESNYRVYERIMWDDNYIEIMCNERATLDTTRSPPFSASGTFVGHGVIDGQKVQVTGIREAHQLPPRTLALECIGTIRFSGNAPS